MRLPTPPQVTASLVLYQTKASDYSQAIRSYLETPGAGTLVVVDNSPEPSQDQIFRSTGVKYLHAGDNPGFGAAHNLGFRALDERAEFHLILNPDTSFEPSVLPCLIENMRADSTIGAAMPQIRFPDGTLQRLCKLLPTPVDLIFRRFIPIRRLQTRTNERYELHQLPNDRISVVPSLSGCFLMVKSELFARLGGFDERYFLYMEDVDLVRRIGDHAKTVYIPHVHVQHGYAKGSYKSVKLLKLHLRSAVQYFCKWGWIFDKARSARNAQILGALRGVDSSPPIPKQNLS